LTNQAIRWPLNSNAQLQNGVTEWVQARIEFGENIKWSVDWNNIGLLVPTVPGVPSHEPIVVQKRREALE
jgi:hypothetical protein